jgi:hypothetical protein
MAKSKEAIEKEIITFLDENSTKKGDGSLPGCGLQHGIACALGTCNNNMPRVTPVDFFNDGLTLWILGDPGGKLGNIRSNPNVSVGIYTRMDHAEENRSIQLWGKASLITRRHHEELFMKTVEKFGILDAVKKSIREGMPHVSNDADFEAAVDKTLNNETLVKIEPEKIAFLILPPKEKSEKLIWEKE